MTCQDSRELLDAYADDELDLLTAGRLDAHLQDCAICRQAFDATRAVKTAASNPALYYKAPAELRQRILAATGRAEPRQARRWRLFAWPIGLAASVLAACAVLFTMHAQTTKLLAQAEAHDVLTAHIRSLQPPHTLDVISTDQHTVKPWFDTHIDFSPPVKQLRSSGFELTGGRLDYLHDRPVAALVYSRGRHIINLFIWPGQTQSGASSERGYNLIHWSADGMTFWAVSDLNLQDLQTFADLVSGRDTTRNSP